MLNPWEEEESLTTSSLKLALTSVCQTKEALKNPAQPTKPKTPAANHALFRLLCAQVDNCLQAQLQVMILNNGSEDGFAALICLRAMFADTDDMDYCQHAMNTLMTGQLKDSEHVFTFNWRFSNAHHNLVGSGQTAKEVDWIRVYLRALRQHTNSRILCKVKSMIGDLGTGKCNSLAEMQQVLVKEEENAKSQGCLTEPQCET